MTVWADWRHNEYVGVWETIIHCSTKDELDKVIKQLKRRKIGFIVKDKHVIIFRYITIHKLQKILGLEVEY